VVVCGPPALSAHRLEYAGDDERRARALLSTFALGVVLVDFVLNRCKVQVSWCIHACSRKRSSEGTLAVINLHKKTSYVRFASSRTAVFFSRHGVLFWGSNLNILLRAALTFLLPFAPGILNTGLL